MHFYGTQVTGNYSIDNSSSLVSLKNQVFSHSHDNIDYEPLEDVEDSQENLNLSKSHDWITTSNNYKIGYGVPITSPPQLPTFVDPKNDFFSVKILSPTNCMVGLKIKTSTGVEYKIYYGECGCIYKVTKKAMEKYYFSLSNRSNPIEAGDIIGCGYNFKDNTIYWTKNETYLGTCDEIDTFLRTLYVEITTIRVYFVRNSSSKFTRRFKKKNQIEPSQNLFNSGNLKKITFSSDNELPSDVNVDHEVEINPLNDLLNITNLENNFLALTLLSSFSPCFKLLFKVCIKIRKLNTLNITNFIKFDKKLYYLNNGINDNKSTKISKLDDFVLSNLIMIFPFTLKCLNLEHCYISPQITTNLKIKNEFKNIEHVRFGRIRFSKPIERSSYLPDGGDSHIFDDSQTLWNFICQHCNNLQTIRFWEAFNEKTFKKSFALKSLTCVEFYKCSNLSDDNFVEFIEVIDGNEIYLSSLILYQCTSLKDYSLSRISSCKKLCKLQDFSIERCDFSTDCVLSFFQNYNNKDLIHLNVGRYKSKCFDITDSILHCIVERFPNLISLNVYRSSITSILPICENLKHLQRLNIGCLKFTISYHPKIEKLFSSLTHLELVGNKFDSEDQLIKLFDGYKSLIQLSFQNCQISMDSINRICDLIKDCNYLSLRGVENFDIMSLSREFLVRMNDYCGVIDCRTGYGFDCVPIEIKKEFENITFVENDIRENVEESKTWCTTVFREAADFEPPTGFSLHVRRHSIR